ncbi:MAG: tripartite tricarboxylate transporter substrate binding protein [Pseudomonadota bacterium]
MSRVRVLAWIAVVALALGASPGASADDYPTRPVRLVAPFPPGGVVDILARTIGQRLSVALGQSVVVENRPGAGGTIGADNVAKAAPDGYTLLLGSVAMLSIAPSVYPVMTYDPVRDFVPIATLADVPVVLVVGKAVPARSVRELIALAQARPETLTFGSSGNGAVPHLAGVLFMNLTGTRLVHVPYRGTAQAINDMMAGQISMIFDNLPSSLSFIQSGSVVALGIGSARRSPSLPDLPTIAEAGVPGYEMGGWFGVLAPAGTADAVTGRLRAEIGRALDDAEFRTRLAGFGTEPLVTSEAEFRAMIASDLAKWAEIVKANHVKVD